MREQKNLWFLTEEKPQEEVIRTIIELFTKDKNCGVFSNNLRIVPLINEDNKFEFTYQVLGIYCTAIDKIFIKTVSGTSSFVDYLIFYQNEEPTQESIPLYAIEQTKTDDKESRNTGVYQRCSKFVFVNHYYHTAKKVMLYSLQVEQKKEPTQTYIFGTRLLLTLGVLVLGKKLDPDIFTPFTSVDEIIEFKSAMHLAPKGNVPLTISKSAEDKIRISARLLKEDSLAHDPNIGAVSLIAAVFRKLGYQGEIEIYNHALEQRHLAGKRNKFLCIASDLNMTLEGLLLTRVDFAEQYWHYETKGEKLATIFVHLIVESFTSGYSIFDNHAGCEKSYFCTSDGQHIPLAKYTDREKYKAGDKTKIVYIPDLVLIDPKGKIIIDIEGKKYQCKQNGIEELKNYLAFDKFYNKKYYPTFSVTRTVVLYGGTNERIEEVKIGFLLNSNGQMILGIRAPELFRQAIKNLRDYWQIR